VLATKNLMDALAVELVSFSAHALVKVEILALDTIFNATLLSVQKAARNGNVGIRLESFEGFFKEV
jgi:hypothetical protein